MGVTDNYSNEDGFGPGPHELTILSVKTVTGTNTGTEGIQLTYCKEQSTDHPLNKTIWQGKFFNKFLTSWIIGLGMNPIDLQEESKRGRGDEWLFAKLPGRHGIFDFCETDKKNDKTGRFYLEPKCRAEVDLAEWIASQNGTAPNRSPTAPEPSKTDTTPPDFPDDIPF